MLQRFISWIRGVFAKMLNISDAKRALKVDVAISTDMRAAIDTWALMFQDKAAWLNKNTQSLGLSAAIAGEIARLTTVEMESTVEGSARADYLQEEYQDVLDNLRTNAEIAAAGGGLVFKPYVDGEHIAVDCVPAWRFLPTSFNSRGEVTGAVFVEQVTKGKTYYTRMEHHQLSIEGYTIRNLAFMSSTASAIGTQCNLASVDEWADLEPETVIKYKDGTAPERVMFAYFRMPFANNIDSASPLGVSVYSRAAGLIEQADKQYSRILWEYEGSELAIDASEGALKKDKDGVVRAPERRKRLFRELGIDQGTQGDLYKVFNPEIRDGALFNGLDKILKRIEFNCYLSYGTLSDPQSVEKTAEEIKTSTGLVRAVDGSRVYTVEGNTSGGSTLIPNGGGVAKKDYPLGYSKIVGYGAPKFMEDDGMLTYEQWKEYQAKYEAEKAEAAPSDWSQDARTWAEGEGLIAGDGSGKMQYKAGCTREMMVVFLYRLFNLIKELLGK